MVKPCTQCGALSDQARCPTHRRTSSSWSAYRNHAAHKRFARAIKTRAQGRCERCGSTNRCQAHHRLPLTHPQAHLPENGILLCTPCHKRTDPNAR